MTLPDVETFFTGDGEATLFSFSFSYDTIEDVNVALLNGDGDYEDVDRTDWSLENAQSVRFDTAPTVNGRIYRQTNVEPPKATFQAGATIRAQDLNANFQQLAQGIEENTASLMEDVVTEIVAGDNITIDPEDGQGRVTINATAEPYTLSPATADTLGGIMVGAGLSITQSGVLSAPGGSPITFKGTADFTAAAPANPDSGDLYLNDTAGTGAWAGFSGVAVGVDDRAFFNGTDWDRLPGGGGGTGAVQSVNGQTGVVVLTASDVGAIPLNDWSNLPQVTP